MDRRFPPHLIGQDGKPKWGTLLMAQWLKSLWVPADFPCRDMGFDLVDGVPTCRSCGVQLLKVGHSVLHPDTPSARLAQRHPEMFA